ncbi:MAG: hypothetical protein M0Z47_05440 [Actinomycetota bacterium]|nr:hypothetical protein [Actinomycetota bacterium]
MTSHRDCNEAAPRFSAPASGYMHRDVESVGLELVRKGLAGDPQEMVSLRAQYGDV